MSTRRCQAQITVEFHFKRILSTELLNETPAFETKSLDTFDGLEKRMQFFLFFFIFFVI